MKEILTLRDFPPRESLISAGHLLLEVGTTLGILTTVIILLFPFPIVLGFAWANPRFAEAHLAWTIVGLLVSFFLFVTGFLLIHKAKTGCH